MNATNFTGISTDTIQDISISSSSLRLQIPAKTNQHQSHHHHIKMKFNLNIALSILALMATSIAAYPTDDPTSVYDPIFARDTKRCKWSVYCSCLFSDGTRCATETDFAGKCKSCPPTSEKSDKFPLNGIKCIVLSEYNDRHHCAPIP